MGAPKRRSKRASAKKRLKKRRRRRKTEMCLGDVVASKPAPVTRTDSPGVKWVRSISKDNYKTYHARYKSDQVWAAIRKAVKMKHHRRRRSSAPILSAR